MPRAAQHVFACNYRLHVGMLGACTIVHSANAHWVPGMRSTGFALAVVTVLLMLGRRSLHLHIDRHEAQRVGSAAWCLAVTGIYLAVSVDVTAGVALYERGNNDAGFGIVVMGLAAVAGVLHASVAPPVVHSLVVLASVTFSTARVVARHEACRVFEVLVWMMHIAGYLLSAHCFEQQATIVRFKEVKIEIEQRNAQLVGEKEKLAWEVAWNHPWSNRDPLAALSASLPPNQPTAQHLVLGVLQPQEITDELVSMAASADHDPTEETSSTPPPGPLFTRAVPPPPPPTVQAAPRSDASGSIASSLVRNNPSLCASSFMESPSKVAKRGPPYAPCMPVAPRNLVHRHTPSTRSMSTPPVRRALAM